MKDNVKKIQIIWRNKYVQENNLTSGELYFGVKAHRARTLVKDENCRSLVISLAVLEYKTNIAADFLESCVTIAVIALKKAYRSQF